MKYLIPVFVLVFLGLPLVVNAQFNLCHIATGYDLSQIGPFGQKAIQFLELIVSLLTLIGVGLSVLVIIVSGIRYMTAGADEAKLTQSKKTLTYGIVGFAVVVSAMFIICLVAELLSNFYAV